MKRLFILFLSLAAATASSAREVINISSGWTFFTAAEATTDLAATVNLPHNAPSGPVTNYLKEFDFPAAWSGKRIFLRINGASRVTDLFVGGLHTATHRGDAPFTVDITGRVTPGSSALIRIVTDSSPRLDVLPTAGREKTYGGLFRTVELIVCEPITISPAAKMDALEQGGRDGVWVTTDRISKECAEGRVRLSLLLPDDIPPGTSAQVKFLDIAGNPVTVSTLAVTSADIEVPFSVQNPHLWQGTADPYLYNIEVALRDSTGLATDSLTVATGFRTVAIGKDNLLTLNGIATKIRGVVLPRDRTIVGTALTPFQIEEDVDLILEMGANAVRVTGGPHSDYFYALCNEAGLLVFNDGPFTGAAYPTDIEFIDTQSFKSSGKSQLAEMIAALYNHPSVVSWGIFSNVTMRSGNPILYITELNALAKSLDSQRLTSATSIADGEINFITELVSFDLALGWESGLPDDVVPWLAQLRKGWPTLRAGLSYAAGGSIFSQAEKLERPSVSSSYHPEGWQTFFHETYARHAVDAPGLWGVFVGNMFDSGVAKTPATALSAAPASIEGAIDDRGLVTFDRKDRKDAFWLYRALWGRKSAPFVRIAGSRLDTRSTRLQTIRVYSSLPEVELVMGGRSLGKRSSKTGIFEWREVALRPGANRLEARSGELSHRVTISLSAQ